MTTSNRPRGSQDHETYDAANTSPSEEGDDYSHLSRHGEAVVQLEAIQQDVSAALKDNEKDGSVSVAVKSSLVELMNDLQYGLDKTSFPSPTVEVVVASVLTPPL